ncbi:hypothetical protein BMW23_1058 [Bodo saltans virus]|uniref:WWE domain-containing protein n=1 Tax=Bodo saltans virus TaxID=2024608 RepID=A0A2H4UVY5_9VIRU|nr:hypothetical protein QJ851_gp1039 [Bodo saltans virus]ATZ81102.1 hypothetical protein BMW23_1058 [Bodo saltans virus]
MTRRNFRNYQQYDQPRSALQDLQYVQSQYNTLCYFLTKLNNVEVNNIINYLDTNTDEAIEQAINEIKIIKDNNSTQIRCSCVDCRKQCECSEYTNEHVSTELQQLEQEQDAEYAKKQLAYDPEEHADYMFDQDFRDYMFELDETNYQQDQVFKQPSYDSRQEQKPLYDSQQEQEPLYNSRQERESTYSNSIFEFFSNEFIDNICEAINFDLKFALKQYDSKTKTFYNIDLREYPTIALIGVEGAEIGKKFNTHVYSDKLGNNNIKRLQMHVKFYDGDSFVKYDDDSSYEILNAKNTGLQKFIIDINDQDYTIDLENMTQTNMKTNFTRTIAIEVY